MTEANPNKEIIEAMWTSLANGDFERFFAAMADDVKFTVMGTTRLSLVTSGKEDMLAKIMGPLSEAIDGEMKLEFDNFIAEGEWVVMQSRGTAVGKNGKPYNNRYCQVFRLESGLVKEWTEYLDTQMLADILDD